MSTNIRQSNARTWVRNRLNVSKGADVASATNVTLGSDGNQFDITGTTTIARINPANWKAGAVIILQFDGACILTHNAGTDTDVAKSLALTGAANYTTVAGDVFGFYYDGALWQEMFRNNTGDSTWADGQDLVLGTTTGTKIGTAAAQLLAFHNATPAIQYATTGTTTGFVDPTGGTAVKDNCTFTGNTGSTAYTIGDIVKCLKLKGLMQA